MKQPKSTTVDYNRLFDALSIPFIAVMADDPDFTIVAQNDQHEVISMTKRAQTLGKPLLKAFPDTSRKYLETGVSDLVESFRTVIATKKSDTMPTLRYDLKRPDGTLEERHWRVTHFPVFDAKGSVEIIYQQTEDITQEIITGERLEHTRAQLEEALSVGHIGAWSWDIAHDRIFADKNLSLMFGLDPEEGAAGLPLRSFVQIIYQDDRSAVEKAIAQTLKQKGAARYEQEYRTVDADGRIRWVIARGRVEVDERGEPKSFPGVIVDITDRKNADHNLAFLAKASIILAESLDYKKNLQSIATIVVPDLADWCAVDILNEKTQQIQQIAIVHKDPSKSAWAREYRAQRPVTMKDKTGIAKVIRTGEPEYYPVITDELLAASAQSEAELKLARNLNLCSAMTVPLKLDGRAVGSITLVSADSRRRYTQSDFTMAEDLANRASLAITKAHMYGTAKRELRMRKRLEAELRTNNEELETRVAERTAQLEDTNVHLMRSNQELQDFAYVASHDLQEPLRKIQAFGNLLEDEYGAVLGDGMDYLTRMRNAAARMSTLIQDLLAFSRVTTKAREFEPVELHQIAKEVTSDLEARIQDTHGEILIGSLPRIMADPLQMRQLLQNLMSNALKFHKPDISPIVQVDATIEYTKKGVARRCRLTVNDNGVGFDEKYLDRIFAVFQRLHGRDQFEGTGIGLAVCRKIVERHGGTITAQSTIGKGSTFIVTLPIDIKKERV